MKRTIVRTIVLTIIIMYLWAIAFTYTIIKSQGGKVRQQEVQALAASLVKTRQALYAVSGQVYEQESWLAEIQADIVNLQAQDEAFCRRLR